MRLFPCGSARNFVRFVSSIRRIRSRVTFARAPKLFECGGFASIQSVATLEDLARATEKRFEQAAQHVVWHDQLDLVGGELLALVAEEVAEVELARLVSSSVVGRPT